MSADQTPSSANIEQHSALQIMALNTHMSVLLNKKKCSEAHFSAMQCNASECVEVHYSSVPKITIF